MLKKLIILAVLIIAILVGWYLYLSNKIQSDYKFNNAPNKEPSITISQTQIPESGISIVVNEQNSSGQGGIATISEVDGKVVVNLKLIGASVAPEPVHLHTGTCEKPGDIVYPLNNVISGASETTLDAGMSEFNSKLPLILNVHKSKEELGVYTACGEVSL